mmetsp:Transcript_1649/g.3390  ORF Transcript_1649/g.3390 Transcript_1649/m.3390 type:complete len:146 (-) Transcript_1649:403-840(-)
MQKKQLAAYMLVGTFHPSFVACVFDAVAPPFFFLHFFSYCFEIAPTHIALKSMEDQTSFYKDTFKMKAAPPMSSAHNRLRNAALDLRADAKAVRGVDSKFVQPYVKAARVVDKGAPGNFFAFFFENPQFRLVQDSVEFGVRPRQE